MAPLVANSQIPLSAVAERHWGQHEGEILLYADVNDRDARFLAYKVRVGRYATAHSKFFLVISHCHSVQGII